MGRVADTPEGCAAVQQDLERLEGWLGRNLMKCNESQHRVLNLGRNDPKCQHRLGDICKEKVCREEPESVGE